MILHLGVDDVPYVGQLAATRKRVLTHAQRVYGRGKTTGQVMDELESKYHLIGTFLDVENDLISSIVEKAMAVAVDEDAEPTIPQNDLNRIEARFRQNLTKRRYDGLIQGVPTLAALRGISHKYMNPYAARGSRPSFIDTSLYRNSFRAWVED